MKLRLKPSKNWIAKILSLLLAIVIWFLIKETLKTTGGFADPPPRGIPVHE